MTLERLSPSGMGNGTVGVSFSKSELDELFVINGIEPDVRGEEGSRGEGEWVGGVGGV